MGVAGSFKRVWRYGRAAPDRCFVAVARFDRRVCHMWRLGIDVSHIGLWPRSATRPPSPLTAGRLPSPPQRHVNFGSKADIRVYRSRVRLPLKSGHSRYWYPLPTNRAIPSYTSILGHRVSALGCRVASLAGTYGGARSGAFTKTASRKTPLLARKHAGRDSGF